MKDYPRWEEDEEEVKESASKAKKQIPTQESQPTRKPDVSVYEAYDEFQENMRYRRMTSLSIMVLHLMTSIKSGRDLMQAQAR